MPKINNNRTNADTGLNTNKRQRAAEQLRKL